MKWLMSFFLVFSMNTFALEANTFSSPVDEQRFINLTKEVRCVVCQNQSIADSNAPLANDLRTKIQQMVLEQKSDVEIKNFLVKRYGEFILLRPRLNAATLLLWSFPFMGLIGVIIGCVVARRKK